MIRFQTFDDAAPGADHPARLAALRDRLARGGLDGFIVPRADAHQGEYVADCDARLAWLTGFTGSAGFAIITPDRAGVFIDGRYRVQVKAQIDPAHFTAVHWPETKPSDWLRDALPQGGRIGFDPWLHTRAEIEAFEKGLGDSGIMLVAMDENPVDAIWPDRPAPPVGAARAHDDAVAGETSADKRARLAEELRRQGQRTAVLTLPDSISWLLNIRGSDLPKNPVLQGFATLSDDGHVTLFTDPAKFDDGLRQALGNAVTIAPVADLVPAFSRIAGPVRIDPQTAPEAVFRLVEAAGTPVARGRDPAILPKSRKNAAELDGMRAAHLRDGAAMVRLLHWLDDHGPDGLTEIAVAQKLEDLRRDAGISDISFDTISGSGPNGAICHYHVSRASDRPLRADELFLIDSGGQYPDGTTDITRTVDMGAAPADAIGPFTAVLRGMIAISRARFPRGVSGGHLDALARQFLWAQGLDYDHGTGHGVGAALCVHEGPVRISRVSDLPLEPGMILSNEPGYYREGAFGIRIENLLIVTPAESEPGRDMLGFETLTFCPIDRRLIDAGALSREERGWLDAYHAQVWDLISPLVDGPARDWLRESTRPL